MQFERGKCYVIAYRKGGVGKSPFRSVLVCSLKDGTLYAIPVEKLARYNAEKKVCEMMGIPMFGKRPEPQTFFLSRVKFGRVIADYKTYMDKKVAEFVKISLGEMKAG
jgi:hypothetical protein